MKYSNKLFKSVLIFTILVFMTGSASFASIATDAKLQYNKGIDYYQLGQFEQSANCFKKAIELDPNYICLLYTSPSPRD